MTSWATKPMEKVWQPFHFFCALKSGDAWKMYGSRRENQSAKRGWCRIVKDCSKVKCIEIQVGFLAKNNNNTPPSRLSLSFTPKTAYRINVFDHFPLEERC